MRTKPTTVPIHKNFRHIITPLSRNGDNISKCARTRAVDKTNAVGTYVWVLEKKTRANLILDVNRRNESIIIILYDTSFYFLDFSCLFIDVAAFIFSFPSVSSVRDEYHHVCTSIWYRPTVSCKRPVHAHP